MGITYDVLTAAGAAERGFKEELEWWDDWDQGVFRLEDGAAVELLGSDGGEPEDNTLSRDWSWVAPALTDAYERGKKESA